MTWYWAQISPGATPLNFFAQKFVLDLFGFSSLTVRLPAILFSVGSLYVFVKIAREYVPDNWYLAAAMFAFLPQIFRYGVEARPYSQGVFFALVAFRYWLRLENAPNRRDALAYGAAVAAGLYSQVFSIFAAVGQTLWSLRQATSRKWVVGAMAGAGALYLPWFLLQRATQAATPMLKEYGLSWQHLSVHGMIRELSGGGYFASVPLLILATFGRDPRLICVSCTALVLPIVADATMGYYFAGRQLIFALPFLVLLATKRLTSLPKWSVAVLLVPFFLTSMFVDARQAIKSREDWETPAHLLASKKATCIYTWSPEQIQYLQVYEPALKQCDPQQLPDEFPFVTTRYSPPAAVPSGYTRIRTESVGVTEIVTYKRDASLKTYGLFRFIFRT